MAELDRTRIIEQMNRGRDRECRDGKWVNGPIPLGYTVDEDGFLIHSYRWVEAVSMSEAALVQDIFHRIANGSTALKEAQRMQALGVPLTRYYRNGTVHTSPTNVWHTRRILDLIRSITYRGLHYFKSRMGGIERKVLPLVSLELWQQANRQLERNRVLPRRPTPQVYLLRLSCTQTTSWWLSSSSWRSPPGGPGGTGTRLDPRPGRLS
jgi:hypothetical protein